MRHRLGLVVAGMLLTLALAACAPLVVEPAAAPADDSAAENVAEPTAEPAPESTEPAEDAANADADSEGTDAMGDTGGDGSMMTDQFAPLVSGIYEGGDVLFIHTATSDPDVSAMLTQMMGGAKVEVVPELADAPASMLAPLYVFTNGLEGMGPFGFQRDVFASVPGDEGYRPLRSVLLTSWNDGATPRELTSVDEVLEAEANGEVTIDESGIVVSFPVMVWPGGSRMGDGTTGMGGMNDSNAGANATDDAGSDDAGSMGGDGSMTADQLAPLVSGIYEGGDVLFIHTATSDPDVSAMLTQMMGGAKVWVVPELADAPASMLAPLYVFTNGLEGMGPFGFQRDIFASVPGDEGYRPLRSVLLTSWNDGATPRELTSVDEVLEAEANGEVTVDESGIVVNFPVMVWPGGSR